MAEKRGGAPVAREIGAPIEDEVGAGRVGGDPLRDLDVDEPPARRKFDQRQQRIGGENRHQHDGKRAGDTLLKAIKVNTRAGRNVSMSGVTGVRAIATT